jgi:hypothetical protein
VSFISSTSVGASPIESANFKSYRDVYVQGFGIAFLHSSVS